MNNLFSNLTPVVKNLLIINIICFIGSLIYKDAVMYLGVHYPDSSYFKVWQPITYMFMHDNKGFGHIFFNMFALVMFGPVIEYIFGSKRFLNYYLICGLGALVLQYGVQAFEVYNIVGTVKASTVSQDVISSLDYAQSQSLGSIYTIPMVGASGAIYGLLLAFGFLFPNRELMLLFIPFPIKAKYFIPILIVIELVLGFTQQSSSIAHLAHVGGALFGFILIKIWNIKRPNFY